MSWNIYKFYALKLEYRCFFTKICGLQCLELRRLISYFINRSCFLPFVHRPFYLDSQRKVFLQRFKSYSSYALKTLLVKMSCLRCLKLRKLLTSCNTRKCAWKIVEIQVPIIRNYLFKVVIDHVCSTNHFVTFNAINLKNDLREVCSHLFCPCFYLHSVIISVAIKFLMPW